MERGGPPVGLRAKRARSAPQRLAPCGHSCWRKEREGRDPQVLDVQGTSALHISTWTVVLSQPLHAGDMDRGASRRKQKHLLCPSLTRGLGHTPSLPGSSSVPDVALNHRTASIPHSALLQSLPPAPCSSASPPGHPCPRPC